MIAFRCPKCSEELEFADAAAGRVVRCPECQTRLRLPGELVERPPRRRKKRRRQVEEPVDELTGTPEWVAPTILLGLGLTLSVGSLALAKGQEGAATGFMLIGLRLLFAVPLSIGGMFIVAPLLGITFGSIGMALLKLAAINVLTLSIVLNVGFGGAPDFFGYAIAAPITWLLFKWMFQLEFTETWIAMTVIDLIQFLASLTITAVAFRASK